MSYKEISNVLSVIGGFSRPRFWIYLAGPFVIGYIVSQATGDTSPLFWFGLLYFLFPANVFLYGINDISDLRIDTKNPKKAHYEQSMRHSQMNLYRWAVFVSVLLSLPLFLFGNQTTVTLLFIFFFLAFFYSVEPLRFKTKPILDFVSNVLYAIPGFIGYALVSDEFPPLSVLVAAMCWTGAMHLFSAIVDITADKNAGIETSATFFGRQKSLIICVLLWFVSGFIATTINPFLFIGFVYMCFPVLVYTQRVSIEWMYRKFPVINAVFGFILFLFVLAR